MKNLEPIFLKMWATCACQIRSKKNDRVDVLLAKSVQELPKIEIVYRRLFMSFNPTSGSTTRFCAQLSEEILEPA